MHRRVLGFGGNELSYFSKLSTEKQRSIIKIHLYFFPISGGAPSPLGSVYTRFIQVNSDIETRKGRKSEWKALDVYWD